MRPPNNVYLYLGAIVLVMLGGLVSAVAVINSQRTTDPIIIVGIIFGFCTPVVLLLMSLLQGAQNAQAIASSAQNMQATASAVQAIVPVVANTHNLVNSAQEQMVKLAEANARALGLADGLLIGKSDAEKASRAQAEAVATAILAAQNLIIEEAARKAAELVVARAEGKAEGLAMPQSPPEKES